MPKEICSVHMVQFENSSSLMMVSKAKLLMANGANQSLTTSFC